MYFVLKIGKTETCATISSHIIKKTYLLPLHIFKLNEIISF